MTATMSDRSGAPPWLGLSFPVRLLLLADLTTSIGIGLTQPLLVVLLHGVRLVPLVIATAMVSLMPLASLPGNWVSGWLVDRAGGHRTMMVGLSLSVVGFALVAVAAGPWWLGLAVVVTGFGLAIVDPAFATLLALGVGDKATGQAFTIKYALFNVGMAAGAAAGALIVRGNLTLRLTTLWWVAAATCAVALVAVRAARVRSAVARPPTPPAGPVGDQSTGGYRLVFADPGMRRLLLAALLASTAGYGVYLAGLPALAIIGNDPGVLSWVNVVNCLTVAGGLPLALWVGKRLRPSQLLVITAGTWSAAWLVCAVQTHIALSGIAVTLPLVAVVFGIGELFLAGALVSLVNERAPEALRGRYNAVLTLAITAGLWIGPLVVAGAVGIGQLWLLFVVAVAMLGVMVSIVRSVPAPTKAANAHARD